MPGGHPLIGPLRVEMRSPLSKPDVRFSREQTVAPAGQAHCFLFANGRTARGKCEGVNRIVSGEIFGGGVVWGDQDFRGWDPRVSCGGPNGLQKSPCSPQSCKHLCRIFAVRPKAGKSSLI